MSKEIITEEYQLVNTAYVCKLFKISRTTLYELVKNEPNFPKPIYLSKMNKRFRLKEIFEYIDQNQA